MITGIYIGSERLELFDDENIIIKSNVAKTEDITKIFTDTSNDFTVPASDVNNAIFKHWYNADVINGFDARKKIPAVILMGGINFKVGKIRLKKVNLKHNQAYSYSVDFFGNLVELKDLIQDDKLTDLDLSALNFVFDSDTVKAKLIDTSDVCFSLLSKRRLLYDSVNTIVADDKQTNIYYDNTSNATGLKPSDVIASVKQLKVIESIEDKYNLSFSRDFFSLYDFNNQYLALSGTGDKTIIQLPLTNEDEGPDPTVSGNVMMASGFGTDTERITQGIQLGIEVDNNYKDVIYSFYIKNGEEIVGKKENVKGDFLKSNVLNVFETSVVGGFNDVTFWVESSEPIVLQAEMYRTRFTTYLRYKYNSGSLTPDINYNVSSRLPSIKIIDYLKGIFKMSKLVAIPQKDGTIYIDSLVNYYRKGKVYDLSEYIDYDKHTVSAGKILNEIKYKYEEPQTILNQQYVKNNGVGYGDLELSIYDDNGVLIDGDKLDFKLPFEQIVYEKIKDISDDDLNTNIQYGLLQDENLEFVTIKPHIHYIKKLNSQVKYIQDNQTAVKLGDINVPTHVLDLALQTFSTTFGGEFNTYNNELINNTLYSNYHRKYIEMIFNVQKREYNFKAKNVPTSIVLKLQLNDVIQIKNNYYRIDSFETNTKNNDIDFKIINDRNIDLTPLFMVTVDGTILTADRTDVTADATTQKQIIEVAPM